MFGDGVPALVEKLDEEIPDDETRKAFGERSVEVFKSGRYRSSFRMYIHIFDNFWLALTARFMITGRRPNIEF